MRAMMRAAAVAMVLATAFGGTGLQAQPSGTARQTLEREIHQGMPYAQARRILLAAGWQPVASQPPCLNQVTPALCAALPEVMNTSSGPIAYTEMQLRHAGSGAAVTVLATGDITRWNRPGEEDEFTVERLSFR
ncbi:MAG TPA: hypothetical protein VGM87_24165 [Roseomonas sp.]|jgi:hypothetical protein